MSEPTGPAVPGWDAAIEAGRQKLESTHWDGEGCGTHGTSGCMYCFGPSPATASEVSAAVLAAAVPHLLDAIEAEAVKVWRCSECGKWSHAKWMPKHHQRFKQAEDAAEDEAAPVGLTVTSMEPSAYGSANPDDESFSSGGWWLRCGPFVPYHAAAARVVATYRKGLTE